MNSPHKGQWRGALMFSLVCAWINCWVNNHEASDLRRHRSHYDVTLMKKGAENRIIKPMHLMLVISELPKLTQQECIYFVQLRSYTGTIYAFNPLWPGDVIWWHTCGSTLAQVMACCLMEQAITWNNDLSSSVLWHLAKTNFIYVMKYTATMQ